MKLKTRQISNLPTLTITSNGHYESKLQLQLHCTLLRRTRRPILTTNPPSPPLSPSAQRVLTAQVEEGVARLDVRQEGVAEALALAGTLHQAGDVGHVQKRRHLAADRRADEARVRHGKRASREVR